MRYPSSRVLFTGALAFAIGIAAAWQLNCLLLWPWCLALVACFGLAWAVPSRPWYRWSLLCGALVCLGGLAASGQWAWWAVWADQLASIRRLEAMETTAWLAAGGRWLVAATGDQWQVGSKRRPPVLQLARGALDPAHHLRPTHAGRCISVSGRLAPPKRAGNPGEFDPLLHALRRNVVGDLRLDAIGTCVGATPSRPPLGARFSRTRELWRQMISRAISGEAGHLVGAIVLGDSSFLSLDVREQLQRAGLAHITSVSGLHVSLVIGTVCLLVGGATGCWGWVPLLAATLFVLLSGAKASSTRALVAAALTLVGRRYRGHVDPWAAVSIAWLYLLTVNPALLGDPGFVLSFSSVAGILLLARPAMLPAPKLASIWQRHWRQLWNGLVLSVGAQLGTVLASARYFHSLPILAPVTNLLGVPLATVALVSGLSGCLLEAWRGFLRLPGYPLLWIAGKAASGLLWLGAHMGTLPWAAVELATPSWGTALAWVSAMVCLSCFVQACRMPRPCRLLALRQAVRWGLLAACIQLLVVGRQLWPPTGRMSITFFDVGQGDALLLQTPGGRAVLVDAGGRTRTWDGSRVLIPQLQRLGVRELAVAVNTHPHADHLGGMAGVLGARRVLWMWETGREVESLTYDSYRQQLIEKEVPVRLARAGDTLHLGKVEVQVLWPPADMAVHHDVNAHSIVLRVVFGRVAVLLMADAPVGVQQALLETTASVDAVLWKVSHQGARSSFLQTFATAVNPQVSVISVGPNTYGHPAPEVVDHLQGMGVVCRTDLDGAVQFVTDGRKWWVNSRHGTTCRASGKQ
jgi:competence protein ComEC